MPDDFSGDEAEKAERYSPVNRRRFVKSLGAASGAMFTSSSVVSASSSSLPIRTTGDPQPVSGDNLGRLVRSVAGEDDIVNLMGKAWSAQARTADVAGMPQDDHPLGDDHPRNGEQPEQNVPPQHALGVNNDSEVVIGATKHQLEDDNNMTIVAFVIDYEQILAFYEYDRAENGVKNKAELWNIIEGEGDGGLSLEDASYNGELIRPVSEMQDDDVSTQSDDPCGGCECSGRGDLDGGYELDNVCATDPNVYSCLMSSGSCAVCVPCSILWQCLSCAILSCPYAVYACCGGTEEACVRCNCSGGTR